MPITVQDVINTLPGPWSTNLTRKDRTIGEIVRLPELRVLGSESHATLVYCAFDEIHDILESPSKSSNGILEQSILVSSCVSSELEKQLDAQGYSYLIGPAMFEQSLFDAVGAMVTQHLAFEDRAVAAGMRALTLIARTSGAQGVLSELSTAIDGWAVLLDSHGQVIESVGAARVHIEDAVSVVLNRPVRIRYPDLQVHIVGSSTGDEHAARLVLASRLQSRYRVRTIAAHAAALLALTLRATKLSDMERHGRELMLDTLINRPDETEALLKRWKITDRYFSAFTMSSRTRNIDVERLASLWLDRTDAAPLYVADARAAYGFAPISALAQFSKLAHEFQTSQGQRVNLGLGEEVASNRLDITLRQAQRAHDAAVRTQRTVLWFADLVSAREQHLELTDEQQVVLENLLDPITLTSEDHRYLLENLHVFLAHHGSWTPAARELGVHRQTLINRMQQVEALLNISLSNPDHRALLWIALRDADRRAQPPTPRR